MMDTEALKKWFNQKKRDLPWRKELSPYHVWVSEIMLQQTQVSVVIPYFERWMQRFPTLEALAEAPLAAVIKEWEGLGYYSRARNLHQGAKYILENYGGNMPADSELLRKIKGIGDYTAGALLSFAFRKKAPAIDGNVIRVIARQRGIEEDIGKTATQKKIRQEVENLLPEHEPWVVSEALIELGATICQKKPKCADCPIKKGCHARLHAKTDQLPFKSAKTTVQSLHRAVAILTCGDMVLLQKGQEGAIMQGLHEFPYFEIGAEGIEAKDLSKQIKKNMRLKATLKEVLPTENHSFTRYRVSLFPHHYIVDEAQEVEGYEWIHFDDVKNLAFSSGHRKILRALPFFNS